MGQILVGTTFASFRRISFARLWFEWTEAKRDARKSKPSPRHRSERLSLVACNDFEDDNDDNGHYCISLMVRAQVRVAVLDSLLFSVEELGRLLA